MTDAVTIAHKYFDALAKGDVAAAMALLDPQVRWHQPGANKFSGVHTGPEAIATLIAGMMAMSEATFVLSPTGPAMGNGEFVAVPVHFRGSRAGCVLDQEGVDLLRMQGDSIVEVFLFSSDGEQEDAFWGAATD